MEPVLALHSSCITVHKACEEISNYANALLSFLKTSLLTPPQTSQGGNVIVVRQG
jgi:hypothetical protein